MTRPLLLILACLGAGSAHGQDLLVNTRLFPSTVLGSNDQTVLDLGDHFQIYASPGPQATFTILMPVPDGPRDFVIGGQTISLMSYKLASGESYDDPYGVDGSDYEWTEKTIQFQLLPAEAPITVANFMTYADDEAYQNTIVHRNESTGFVFRPGGLSAFNALSIIQAGGLTISDEDGLLFEWIPNRPAIAFEPSRSNTQGTLAMARTSAANSATSQFFINTENNTNSLGKNYSVFAELLDFDASIAILKEFANTPVYDLTSSWQSGAPGYFSQLPFTRVPLYAPSPTDASSYARFKSISTTEGTREGVGYSYDFIDLGEEGVSDEELAYRAVFDIAIEGSELRISRHGTGEAAIKVTGTYGADQTSSFNIFLTAYNPEALDQFPVSNIYQDGWIDNFWYGWISADSFPSIRHLNHGYQYVADSGSSAILNAYDYGLESWIYTTSTLYPFIYFYRGNQWLLYQEDSGNGADELRWFYRYSGDSSSWVTEDAI